MTISKIHRNNGKIDRFRVPHCDCVFLNVRIVRHGALIIAEIQQCSVKKTRALFLFSFRELKNCLRCSSWRNEPHSSEVNFGCNSNELFSYALHRNANSRKINSVPFRRCSEKSFRSFRSRATAIFTVRRISANIGNSASFN